MLEPHHEVASALSPLLHADEPPVVEHRLPQSHSPVLFTCEHASHRIPRKLADLGLSKAAVTTHIGWDIGAAAVTRLLSRHFAATAILQNYSRLVVDCNRDPAADDFIISCSDGTRIPGNQSLSEHARQQRRAALFEPYDRCISKAVMAPHVRLILSIHSFTPIMDGFQRPWDIGFLFIRDTHTSHSLAAALSAIRPELCIGFNQPYNATTTGRFIQAHGEPSGVAHALIEIRNDHIDSAQGQAQWATYLIAAIEHHLAQNG